MFLCCCCTADNSAGVKAAVLLAPVGSDAGALWEVAHRWRFHIDYLHIQKNCYTSTLYNRLGTCTKHFHFKVFHISCMTGSKEMCNI